MDAVASVRDAEAANSEVKRKSFMTIGDRARE
jgi:hypothetical protein